MEQHLRGEYKAAAAGGKLYAFINAMQKAGVCCRKQHCQGTHISFAFTQSIAKLYRNWHRQTGCSWN